MEQGDLRLLLAKIARLEAEGYSIAYFSSASPFALHSHLCGVVLIYSHAEIRNDDPHVQLRSYDHLRLLGMFRTRSMTVVDGGLALYSSFGIPQRLLATMD